MNFSTKFRYWLLIILTLNFGVGYSQTDYEFWFAAPEISYAVTAPPAVDTVGIDRPIVLVISTCEGPAIVRISQPANPAFQVIIDTLQTGDFHQINVSSFIDLIECKPANTILNCGLLISSTKPINTVYEIQNRVNTETYTLKGNNALGNEFIIPAQNQYSNYPYCDPPARNSISFVATENETTVIIVPTHLMEGQPGLDTIYVSLNRGQAWSCRAFSADSNLHLGGTFILANKPIAVTVTDDAVRPNIATGLSIDIAGDQLLPRHLMGTEFLAFPVDFFPGYVSMLYIYAIDDGTSISIDGSVIGNLNRGEVIKHMITSYLPSFIQSSNPVEVYLFYKDFKGSSEVAGEIIAPLSCTGSYHVTFARTGPYGIGDAYTITALCKTVDCANFTCSNPIIQAQMIPSNFILIPSTGNQWGYYGFENPSVGQLTYSNSTGNFQISAINELQWGGLRTSTYTNYSGLNLGPDRMLCLGDTILLDAGFGTLQYLWNTGATSRTINVTSAGTYWVQKISASCTLSDTIVITNINYTPIYLGGQVSICAGDSTLLDAGPGKSWYQWNTGQITSSIYVHDTGTYWVTVPVSPCNFNDSDTVHVSVYSATGLGPDRGVCSGDSVSLDAGAGMTAYLWNTGATSQTIEAKVSGSYSVIMHYKNCTFYDTVNVTAFPTPVVNLGTDDSICAGETHTFNAGFCSGCTYSWDNLTLGQTNIGTGQTYTTAQPGTYVANVTGNNGCIGRDTIRLLTKSGLPVNISILSSANSICSGIPVTYTATPVNGGTLPTYQWKVNDSNAGTNSSVFTFSPTNGDIVTCLLTSSISVCISNNPATSNSITMVVNPLQPVSVAVSTSANPVCAGTSVTFNAMPTNGGTIPIYQWKVNGIDTGSNLPVFNFTPINGDALSCALTSNANCPIGNPAFSIPINMVVNPLLPVSISISPSANPFCLGNPVTYTAIPVNGGPSPTYQWKVKGTNVGGNSPTYTYSPVNGDSVRCVMISNLNCVIENPASSAKIIMLGTLAPTVVFTSCFDTLTTVNAKPYKLRGGIPLGGTYSGPGVNSVTGIFTPSIAGTGLKSMVYTYTNVSLCSANKTNTIIVQSTASFTCGNNLTDIRDSKTYPTVQIGTQCWMAANLNYGNQITPSHVQFDNCIAEKYCYNDNPLNCTNNGGLYQWDEMMKYDDTPAGQGLCPPGWHVPTENDWTTLFNFYLGKAFAGKPLQDSIITGFKALTSGVFYLNSSWSFNGFATLFWSSTPWNATKGISHGLNVYDYSVSMYPSSRANAFPVRCLCD